MKTASLRTWAPALLALALAGCGGEDDGETVFIPFTFGSGNTGGGGTSDDDFCDLITSVWWCDDAGGSSGSGASTVHSQISDVEPNDDVGTAVVAHWPRNYALDQRIGFGVQGSVDGIDDVADFFAFTPDRSADFHVSLCVADRHCGPWTSDDRIDVAMATVRVLDQSGIEILSEALYPGSANVFETRFEAGVPYYAVVVAEDVSGAEIPYRLTVGESMEQSPAEDTVETVPEAPELSALVLDSVTNVQFDWIPPTHNEDGSQLDDLAGFNLYLYDCVREGNDAERRLIETVGDPAVTTRTLKLEGYLDWCVSITAFNDAGIESRHSEEVWLVDPP